VLSAAKNFRLRRKQDLESGRIAAFELLLGPQKLLQRPKPAGHIDGDVPHVRFLRIRIVALQKRSKLFYRKVPQPLLVPFMLCFLGLRRPFPGELIGRGLAVAPDLWNGHVEKRSQFPI